MAQFTIAKNSMLDELIEMTIICFGDTEYVVKFFFENKVDLSNCVVCIEDNRVVAQLHMIPIEIKEGEQLIDCHYIYNAATLPPYRNRGLMTNLIKYAHKIAKKRHHKYSILSPANESLYRFYEKIGYQKFYKYREVVLLENEICQFKPSGKITNIIDYSKIHKIRSNFYCRNGEIVWDIDSIKYAFDLNCNFSGINIYNGSGYAMAFSLNSEDLEIFDIAYDNGKTSDILGDIYSVCNDKKRYIFRLPVNDKLFYNRGTVKDKAMIYPLCNKSKEKLISFTVNGIKEYPCIGFVME